MVKICPICQTTFPTKVALAAHMPSHQRQQKRGRGKPRNSSSTLTLALKELWGEVKSKSVVTIDCKPASSGLLKLSGQAPMFETYKLTAYTVHVVKGGSQSTSGIYFMGVSYKASGHPTTSKGVAALAPMVCKNANENASLSVPCSRIMGQPWLDNDGPSPGAVIVANDTTASLHIWISYRVIFNGPTTSSTQEVTLKTDGRLWTNDNGEQLSNFNLDFDAYGELEIASSSESAMGKIWTAFSNAVTRARELHRAWVTSIGMVHMVVGMGNMALPQLGTPAILHLIHRPFRATADEWRLLGVETASSTGGSGARKYKADFACDPRCIDPS